jgi:hypothetical protein
MPANPQGFFWEGKFCNKTVTIEPASAHSKVASVGTFRSRYCESQAVEKQKRQKNCKSVGANV